MGDTSCRPHAGDYNPCDWQIGLSELLRLVLFFNAKCYYADPGTEDGYAPGPAPCESEGEPQEGEVAAFHSADLDNDAAIDTSELLRIVQFFNAGGFHCQADSEDGYAPEALGDQSCGTHNSDYAPHDWRITLNELLRAIQFFNVGAYHSCATGEDGFCPG